MFLKRDQATLFVMESGPGPQTLVAHGGFVGSGELWAEPFSSLSRTWRTITYDHRGAGVTRSAGPITGEQLVSDLECVLQTTGATLPVLAGESMGAKVVLAVALRAPEKLRGLVIVDGVWTQPKPGGPADALITGCRADYRRTIDDFVDNCIVEADGEDARHWARQIVYRSSGEAAAQLLEAAAEIDIPADWLGRLKMPILVIHGSEDRIVPLTSSEELCRRLPSAELKVISGAGHVPTLTRGREVAEAIELFFST